MKKLTVLIVFMLVLTFCLPVQALTVSNQALTATCQNLSDRLALRQDILDLRIQVINNHLRVLEQTQENTRLRQELLEKFNAEQGQIPADTLAQLKNLNQQVKALADEIRDTRGDIQTIVEKLKGLNPRDDLDEMKQDYTDIYAVQNLRIEKLKVINSLLQQMLEVM